MAVYKIFPHKDTTLYSFYPNMNTGIDAINQISNLNIAVNSNPQVARFLIEFVQDEIEDVINNIIGDKQWDVNLKSFIATAQGVNESIDINVFPIAQSWNNGTGGYLDVPQTTDGATWYSPYFQGSIAWSPGGNTGGNKFTSSFNPNFVGQGGGNWFYEASGSIDLKRTQSFDTRSDKDLNINVKPIVERWYSGSLPNYGFITKFELNVEWNENLQIQPVMQFFSSDTNTIYPPELEFKWIDYQTVLTSSLSSSILNSRPIIASLAENPGVFKPNSINRFRINVAPKYQPEIWVTSSVFTDVNFLPTSSCYAIKDLDTNEFIINFDDTYTQISSDENGNYFDIYMNGLEPERYYKVLIKTKLDNSVLVLDDNYYFKVING